MSLVFSWIILLISMNLPLLLNRFTFYLVARHLQPRIHSKCEWMHIFLSIGATMNDLKEASQNAGFLGLYFNVLDLDCFANINALRKIIIFFFYYSRITIILVEISVETDNYLVSWVFDSFLIFWPRIGFTVVSFMTLPIHYYIDIWIRYFGVIKDSLIKDLFFAVDNFKFFKFVFAEI